MAEAGRDDLAGTFEHDADVDHQRQHTHQSEEHTHTGAKAGGKDISSGEGAEAAHDRSDEPIKGGGEEPEPLIPDAREAVGETLGGDGDGLIGMGARAKAVHDHHPFAELAGHEEIADVADTFGSPDANQHDANKVNNQNKPVRQM